MKLALRLIQISCQQIGQMPTSNNLASIPVVLTHFEIIWQMLLYNQQNHRTFVAARKTQTLVSDCEN